MISKSGGTSGVEHPSLSVDVQGIAFNDIHTLLDALTAKDREIEKLQDYDIMGQIALAENKKLANTLVGVMNLIKDSKVEEKYPTNKTEYKNQLEVAKDEITTLKSLCDELAEALRSIEPNAKALIELTDYYNYNLEPQLGTTKSMKLLQARQIELQASKVVDTLQKYEKMKEQK